MRDALRTARAWLADVLMPTPLTVATSLGLVHREATDEQDGDDRG
jgi:hypothetical protein